MNTRSYTVSSDGRPDDTLTGNWTVAAWDAAKNYAGIHLPGFAGVSCRYVKCQDTEKHGLHTLWRAEAYNGEEGRAIWVREL